MDSFGIETVNAPDQRVVEDVAAIVRVRRVAFDVHETSEAGKGVVRVGGTDDVDHRAPIGMVERHAASGVDAAETDDDGQWGTHVG